MNEKILKLIQDKKLYFNPMLLENVKEIIDMIRIKFDGVLLIDGMEGSGKSELGKQICLVSDKNFTDKDVFYSVEQFEEWLENAPPGKAGLWDEFVLAGLSSDALTAMQTILIKKFTMIRKKGLIIILVIPYIFLLRKYFAVARTRCLIHVYTKGKQRGFFKFYNYQEKLWIYNYGAKTWLYSPKVNPSFEGHFTSWADNYLDVDKIEEKKDQAIEDVADKGDKKQLIINDLCRIIQYKLNGELNEALENLPFPIARASFFRYALKSQISLE